MAYRPLQGSPRLVALISAISEIRFLDRPLMGLKPDKISKAGVSRTFQNIRAIQQSGVAVLLVEQNAAIALAISHRGYLLETKK